VLITIIAISYFFVLVIRSTLNYIITDSEKKYFAGDIVRIYENYGTPAGSGSGSTPGNVDPDPGSKKNRDKLACK